MTLAPAYYRVINIYTLGWVDVRHIVCHLNIYISEGYYKLFIWPFFQNHGTFDLETANSDSREFQLLC